MDNNKRASSSLEAADREKIEQALKIVAHNKECLSFDFAINPFDTHLGCRYPTLQERGFLVNLITLLGTPIGSDKPYDGVLDMVNLIVDEVYKRYADDGSKANVYITGTDEIIDGALDKIDFIRDNLTTWWEVTDMLFLAGFTRKAMVAQCYAMPLLSGVENICRTMEFEDSYGKITVPTGETLIDAFLRIFSRTVYEHPMLSQPTRILSGVHEYPMVSRQTKLDLDEKIVAYSDLSEAIKNNGDTANRDLVIMYMLARHVLARYLCLHLPNESMTSVPSLYKSYYENLCKQ